MLKQILAQFQQARQPLCLDELSQILAIEASALEGMLDSLVQRGRLVRIDPANYTCGACPAKGGCVILTNGLAKRYILPPARTKLK